MEVNMNKIKGVNTKQMFLIISFLFLVFLNNSFSEDLSFAKITSLSGEVEILVFDAKAAKQDWIPATLNVVLKQGDEIRTKNGKAEITFDDGSKVNMKENTSITLAKMKDSKLTGDTIIKLWLGKIKVKFKLSKDDSSFQVKTKDVIAAVKGTEFIVSLDSNDTVVTVLEGIVSMSDPITGKEIFVKANEKASYASVFQGKPQQLAENEQKLSILEWEGKQPSLPLEQVAEAEEGVKKSAPPAMSTVSKPEEKKQAPKEEGLGENFGGAFGAVSVDGKTYYMLSILFELTFAKLGVGFDVRLLWDDNGIKEDDWQNWQKSLQNTFKYVRYGLKGDEFYAKLGIIDSATLGHGFIMRRYSNVGIDLYNRKFGTELDVNLGEVGLETVTNDIMWERLIGARAYLNIIPNFLKIGGTVVYDNNPAKDKFAIDPLTGTKVLLGEYEGLMEYGADVGISIINTDLISVLLYADWAKIKDKGEGFSAPGIMGKLFMFDYQFEYRSLQSNFIANLFDYLYEERRPISFPDSGEGRLKGIFGEIGWSPVEFIKILGALEKYEGANPYVRAEASYKGNFIPKISEVSVGYEQKDVKQLELKNPNTVVYGKVGLTMSPGVILAMTVKQTYDPVLDKFKRTTIMGVQMKF